MANTVNILSYNNTFGDLVAQQNLVASELNNLGANNYTKNTGTLYLTGLGTGLSVTNTAILGTAVVSNTTTAFGDITASANVFINGLDYAFQVKNDAIVAKTLITNQVIANTIVRTDNSLANNITANNIVRSYVINATGSTYTDSLQANTVITSPKINGTTLGIFQALTSNTSISTASILASGAISSGSISTSSISATGLTVTGGTITVTGGTITTPTISGALTGQATLTGISTAPTGESNTSNTQIATTAWVKNVLNSGNTFNLYASTLNAYTLTMNQNVNTANGVQFNSLGVGTTPSATTGEIRATNNITAYYSDDRLKTRLGNIENALAKVMSLNGFQYEANETAQALGYEVKPEIGLSAQEVQAVLPEVVVPAPIDEKYLTIHYERVIPLLVEAIKELKREIDSLKK
jgi:hypothetical protein